MPTPTMPDEDLDALFRRGAQAYPDEVPPPAAWKRMERQLDAAAATQRLRRQVGRIFAVELLVLLLLVWQGYQYVQRPAEVAARPSAATPGAAHLLAARPQAATASRNITSPADQNPDQTTEPATAAMNAAPTPSARAEVATAALPPTTPKATVAAGNTVISKNKHLLASKSIASKSIANNAKSTHLLAANLRPAHRARQPAAEQPATTQIPLAGRPFTSRAGQTLAKQTLARRLRPRAGTAPTAAHPAATEQAARASATQPELLAYVLPQPLVVAPYPLPDSLTKLATATTLPPDSAKTKKRPAPRPAYRLVLGVLGAPSFSGVRTAQSAMLGGDYGLTLDYRFAPRLRVRVGVISSQKRYQAASTDYRAPAAWQWPAGSYTLDANCRVTEIPIDLRYDVLRRPSYTVFSSLGLNSLLMRNERYSYDWTMSGQTFTKTAQVVDGSNHFLSVLNVSVGLERPLGVRWSAQVEPYWQFPLGGVGAGQVRLSSAGAAFSLKYGLFR